MTSANLKSPLTLSGPNWGARFLVGLGRLSTLWTIAMLVLAWEAACHIFSIPPFILPAPSAVFKAASDYGLVNWMGNTIATLTIVVLGFLIAVVVSIPLAVLLTHFRFLGRTIYPVLIIVQSTPIVAIAPIIVVILGTNIVPRLVIVFLIAFFPLVVSTATGLASTPSEFLELSRSLKAGTRREYLHIRLPFAVPHIFSALRISVTLAVIGSVVAEFVASDKGLGFMILFSTSLFKVPQAFAALAILVCSSIALYQFVVLFQVYFFAWSVPQEQQR